VAAVTLVSVYLIYPTILYFLALPGYIKTADLEGLRKQSVPLGLDLQGGVDVLLAIDVVKTRHSKVQGYADELQAQFRRESPGIDANVEVTSDGEKVLLTLNKPEQERAVDNILIKRVEDQVFTGYEAGTVKAGKPLEIQPSTMAVESEVRQNIDSALTVIRERVNKLGVTQPVVVKQGDTRIRVQIPGEKDPDEVTSTIIRPAKLEFRGVSIDTTPFNDQEGKLRYRENSASYIDPKTGKPLAGKTIPPGYEARLHREVKSDRQTGKLETSENYMLVKRKVEMTGEDLQNAWVFFNQASLDQQVQVMLEFKPRGAKRFADVTAQYVNKPLAILLDGIVYSYPNVNEQISGGTCSITGGFSMDEAKNLSLILKAGALPAELVTKEKRTVEASLGADSIKQSVYALGLGTLIVALYMIAYYSAAGVIAVVAVLINVLIIFAFMKLASATLTLSGIGGILLTVGMAVDANVLIYERIREELHLGKSLRTSINLGFGRAFSVIFDANLTTLISGLVLLQFGVGSVKGFALTLNIGILATLFTGLFCTHALVDGWYLLTKKLAIGRFQWFRDRFYFDFVGLRKYSYVFSIVLFTLSILWIMPFKPFPGSNWGVDFEGGAIVELEAKKDVNAQEIQAKHPDWRVQKVAGEQRFFIRTKFEGAHTDINAKAAEVAAAMESMIGKESFTVLGVDAVSNEVGGEFTSKALLAVVLASIGILIYMWFRFEFAFGFAAVVALFHDVVIAYGLYNILGHYRLAGEVTLDVVAALLVILGYSVNDTIIIFDRIRENLKLHPSMPFRELINHSICESLNRTVMTVSTVVIVLAVMLLVGGAGLYDFALVLLIGIIKGTYSSSFVASPILYEIYLHRRKKGGHIVRMDDEKKEAQGKLAEN
jgi:SecD/SecF fusion protein